MSAGVHYDDISKKEIAAVERMADALTELPDRLTAEQSDANMLTVKDLEELKPICVPANWRRTSRTAAKTTVSICWSYKKLMVVAELADATATRLIFRGLPVPPPPAE